MWFAFFSLIVALILGLNRELWHNQILALVTGFLYLGLVSLIVGRLIKWTTLVWEKILWGLLIVLAATAVLGSAIFYLYNFADWFFYSWLLLLPLVSFFNKPEKLVIIKTYDWKFKSILLTAALIVLLIVLYLNQITIAVRSPWQMLPALLLIVYGLLVATFIIVSRGKSSVGWLIPLTLGTWLLLPVVFPLVYGFDPWIHQASEKILQTTGAITPKPMYYLGQYVNVVWLSNLLSLPITLIDKWLLPILASLVGAVSWLTFTKSFIKNNPRILLITSLALIFPWSIFTITTPQGLANLWALAVIMLLATKYLNKNIPWWPILLLAAACIFTHPLPGLPLWLIILLSWLIQKSGAIMIWPKILTALAIVLVIPAAFLFFSQLTTSGASVELTGNLVNGLKHLTEQILASLPAIPAYIDLVDFVYFWTSFLTLGFLFLAAWGLYQTNLIYPKLKLFAFYFALLASSFVLMTLFLSFPYLVNHEQNFYTQRIWDLSLLFLWPLVLIGIYDLWQKIWNKGETARLILLLGVITNFTCAFYLSYPRHDLYHKDTGYNTTTTDIAAVKLIDNDAANLPYVVLANQAVSAAALAEFGFAHYYSGNLYYPLPTGTNPLYQVFLKAAEQDVPRREVIKQAYEISGVNRVYLVLNQYWADFDKLTQVAQNEANASLPTLNGYLKIYRYDF